MKNLILFVLFMSLISCGDNDKASELPTHLEGDLEINSLKDLEDPSVQAYKSISGILKIHQTYELEDLRALQKLEEVKGIFIHKNKGLKSLRGLENIKELEFLDIRDNQELASLEGVENLASISASLAIDNNDKLKSLAGLKSLVEIGEQLFIFDNAYLPTLLGLEKLKIVPQLLITNNIRLLNVDGLGGLTTCSDLRIDSNDSLVDFCAMTDFMQNNKENIAFAARMNSYNPTVEDFINGDCAK